jgi:P-type E1-E2 ATPase
VGHLERDAAAAAELGQTAVFAADSTGRAVLITLGDELRDDAPSLIAELQNRDIRVSILSGDDPTTVRRVADPSLVSARKTRSAGCHPIRSSLRSNDRSNRRRSRWLATA